MAHAFTAVMNGRDLIRFLDIPENLVDHRVRITIDPIEKPANTLEEALQKLFAGAPNIKITDTVRIDTLMNEMNDALS